MFSDINVAIIIPSLNAGNCLPRLLPALRGFDAVMVDGGSDDDSVALAKRAGVKIITTRAGRGHQMALGARTAYPDKAWLFFLHADSQLSEGWHHGVKDFIASDGKPAAVFRFSLDDQRFRARLLEFFVRLRCLIFALPYGDQGLLIRRDVYDSVGGFADMDIMEDVALMRKLSRSQIHFFSERLTTSADRFRDHGYMRQIFRNMVCLIFYFSGAAPDRIARLYRKG